MLCQKCKDNNHIGCPSNLALDPNKPSMGLSTESERVQVAGLCTCQHRNAVVRKSDIGTEFVVQVDAA